MLQRAVKTWAGEFDTDKYDVVNEGGSDIGVEMELRFKPGAEVDARKIGMVQTANTKDLGKVVALNPTVAGRSIGAGLAGEGAHIDQLARYRNPLYATGGGAAGSLRATPTQKQWGQHGWHYTTKGGTLKQRDALLKDRPTQPGHGASASQVFETTALAIEGEQQGAYYGSVQWGWETDAAGTFSKLPLTQVSNDAPSATFGAAAELWNKGKTSGGKSTVDLPLASGMYVNADGVELVQKPSDPAGTVLVKLDKNARVEVVDRGEKQKFNAKGKTQWWKVTVVDGASVGAVGWVMETQLSAAAVP
jgi:hypothetical protein